MDNLYYIGICWKRFYSNVMITCSIGKNACAWFRFDVLGFGVIFRGKLSLLTTGFIILNLGFCYCQSMSQFHNVKLRKKVRTIRYLI